MPAFRPSTLGSAVTAPLKPKRTRLLPHEREEQIVAGAIEFFSEVGFGGQTRELARRLGITQGLLYRYFPDKQALLERVYSTIFEGRWSPRWEDELQDRSVGLTERLIRFYSEYGRVIHTSDWVRTYLLAGLGGLEINRRYRALLRRRIFPLVINEIRHDRGMPPNPLGVISEEEDELMMTLHGMIFYEGIRKWVYRMDVPKDPQLKLKRQIAIFLYGAELIYKPQKY
jgi:AcrR family transcriptional regulator